MKLFITVVCLAATASTAVAFEGRINATITRGAQSDDLRYTVGRDFLRVEMTATNRPYAVDVVDRQSGALTLLFPHNRSFVRLQPAGENSSVPSGFRQMPDGLPPGASPGNLPGTQALSQTPSAPNMPQGMPVMPAMPATSMMPPAMAEKIELKDTGKQTNILGFVCEQYEIKQRGETMEIWATNQLFPFQPYVQSQPLRSGPRLVEEQWAGLVTARKLFPLWAALRYDAGTERFRFEVKSITPEEIADRDGNLFQPPPDYHEIRPLTF